MPKVKITWREHDSTVRISARNIYTTNNNHYTELKMTVIKLMMKMIITTIMMVTMIIMRIMKITASTFSNNKSNFVVLLHQRATRNTEVDVRKQVTVVKFFIKVPEIHSKGKPNESQDFLFLFLFKI